jgi:hypothetical protein
MSASTAQGSGAVGAGGGEAEAIDTNPAASVGMTDGV